MVGARAASDHAPGRRASASERRISSSDAASRAPCRAARCPSPRRHRSRATTDDGERRAWRPSRSPRRATDRLGERIGDDVRGRVGNAVEAGARGAARDHVRRSRSVYAPRAVGVRQPDVVIARLAQAVQRRHVEPAALAPARKAELGELHALGAFEQVQRNGAPSTTWRMNNLPLHLERVVVGRFAGTFCQSRRSRWSAGRPGSTPASAWSRAAASGSRAVRRPRAVRAVDLQGQQIVAAHAHAPRTVELRDDAALELEVA